MEDKKISCFWCGNKGKFTIEELEKHTKKEHIGLEARSYDLNKMEDKKILICCPIGGLKQYSINLWFQWIANQKYKNYEISICSNGKDGYELHKKIQKVRITDVNGQDKQISSLLLPNSNKLTVIQKITYSRERLRRYAIENNFDGILFLDSDTIPANRNAIELLLSKNKDVISGLYHYKESSVPVVIDKDTHTNISEHKILKLVNKDEICEVWGFGYGCLLLTGEALKVAFDYKLFGQERTDDFGHCEALQNAGFKRWLYPFVLCKHFGEKSKLKKINDYIKINLKD